MQNNPKAVKNRHQGERGQTIYIVTFAAIALIAMLGLIIDGSIGAMNQRHEQNAADAAAFAVANYLAHTTSSPSDGTVVNIINSYAHDLNGGNPDLGNSYYIDFNQSKLSLVGTGTVPPKAAGVYVSMSHTYATYFAPILNITGYNVTSKSAAVYGVNSISVSSGVAPFVFPQDMADSMTSQGYGTPLTISDINNSNGNNKNTCTVNCFLWSTLNVTYSNSNSVIQNIITDPGQYSQTISTSGNISLLNQTSGQRTSDYKDISSYYVGNIIVAPKVQDPCGTNTSCLVTGFLYLYVSGTSNSSINVTVLDPSTVPQFNGQIGDPTGSSSSSPKAIKLVQ